MKIKILILLRSAGLFHNRSAHLCTHAPNHKQSKRILKAIICWDDYLLMWSYCISLSGYLGQMRHSAKHVQQMRLWKKKNLQLRCKISMPKRFSLCFLVSGLILVCKCTDRSPSKCCISSCALYIFIILISIEHMDLRTVYSMHLWYHHTVQSISQAFTTWKPINVKCKGILVAWQWTT